MIPSYIPSFKPTIKPRKKPSYRPSYKPTSSPTSSKLKPTIQPTSKPNKPSSKPMFKPSSKPNKPSSKPSRVPSNICTNAKYYVSGIGESCITACRSLALKCHTSCQSTLNTLSNVKLAYNRLLNSKPYVCSTWIDDERNGEDFADPGFYYSVGCFYASTTISTCTSNNIGQKRICACI